MISIPAMADSPTPAATAGRPPGTGHAGGKTGKRLPVLAQQVAQTEIPVLTQAAGASSLDDDLPVLPVLGETFAEFRKTVPVLEQSAHPSAPASLKPGVSRASKTRD